MSAGTYDAEEGRKPASAEASSHDKDDDTAAQARRVLLDEGYSAHDIDLVLRYELDRERSQVLALAPAPHGRGADGDGPARDRR